MKERFIRSRALMTVAGVLAVALPVQADEKIEEALELLNRMSAAMTQMTYQGTFVYVQGQQVETLRITHVVDRDGIHERLVAQSGPSREILRSARGVQWISGGNHAVVQEPSLGRGYFPQLPANGIRNATDHYEIELSGEEPLAGRMSSKVRIAPKDPYRYGYNLWLEKPSGLLLKWELYEYLSEPPLARLMFTDLRLGDDVDRRELSSGQTFAPFQSAPKESRAYRLVSKSQPAWAPVSLPEGFALTSHQKQDNRPGEETEHLVYSDGIASVSVFVDRTSGNSTPPSGISRMGTTHAFSRRNHEFQVTVVGDVPALTVEEIGMAVNLDAY